MGGSMTRLVPGLYVGSWKNAGNENELMANCITHILSLHDTRQELTKSSSREYLHVWAADNDRQSLNKLFVKCHDFIHSSRQSGGNCLVHCMAGVSRSVSICTSYIMTTTTLSYPEALAAIRGRRPSAHPNPSFQRQLASLQSSGLLQHERDRLMTKFGEWFRLEEDMTELREALSLFECNGACYQDEEVANVNLAGASAGSVTSLGSQHMSDDSAKSLSSDD